MNTKCPHCGTSYEVSASELGHEGVCEKCGKSFVIRATASATNKHIIVSHKGNGKAEYARQRSKRHEFDDVEFISSTIGKLMQWIGYIGVVCYCVVFVIACMKREDFISVPFALLGMVFALLMIRLWYEFVVAIFEIVRHLREIRTRLYSIEE